MRRRPWLSYGVCRGDGGVPGGKFGGWKRLDHTGAGACISGIAAVGSLVSVCWALVGGVTEWRGVAGDLGVDACANVGGRAVGAIAEVCHQLVVAGGEGGLVVARGRR